ncbi:PGN_0703 family putative restriction endonuclease [Pseudonocardia aurantiaca]
MIRGRQQFGVESLNIGSSRREAADLDGRSQRRHLRCYRARRPPADETLGLCEVVRARGGPPIGARYSTTVRTCERYAKEARLVPLEAGGAPAVIGTEAEQPLSAFVADASAAGVEPFAQDVLRNRQRTSSRGGVLKAAAALRYAQILVEAGVELSRDVPLLFADEARMVAVANKLRSVPGNGMSDVRLGYFWRLLGDDDVIKPDRMVLRWLEGILGRRPSVPEARAVLVETAATFGCTPWELDHAVWHAQRSRRPVISSDSATSRKYRAHQGRWRDEVLGLPAGPPTTSRTRSATGDSMLPAVHDGVRAEDAGWNLMSQAAVDYARARVPVIKAAEGMVETDRLWRNMLSSQPLAFSIVGEMRAHCEIALEVLSELSGHHLVAFDRVETGGDPWSLDGLQAEWAPPRLEHTCDRSGFDIAAAVRTSDDRRMIITVEVKYTDRFSASAFEPARYLEALRYVGIDVTRAERIVAAGGSQFLRSVLLTDSVRRGGKSGVDPLDAALAVVLSRDDDRTAARVVQGVAEEQPTVSVAWWGLGAFLDVVGRHGELADWVDAMRARYLPDTDRAAPIR